MIWLNVHARRVHNAMKYLDARFRRYRNPDSVPLRFDSPGSIAMTFALILVNLAMFVAKACGWPPLAERFAR